MGGIWTWKRRPCSDEAKEEDVSVATSREESRIARAVQVRFAWSCDPTGFAPLCRHELS
jgi:hypothetical protein